MSTPCLKSLGWLVLPLILAAGRAAPPDLPDNSVTGYPAESTALLKNPGRGFFFYASNKIKPGHVSPALWNIASAGYLRCNWSQLEPIEGQYNWPLIDDSVAACAAQGNQMGLAIMLACINSDTSYHQSTPLWVFDAGAAYTLEKVQQGTVEVKIPVWDDPVVMRKFGKLVEALRARYDRPDSPLAYIDIRNFGNWGEWHLGNLPHSVDISVQAKEAFVDMWSGFKFLRLIMLFNDQPDAPFAKRALVELAAGFRRDGCLNPQHPDEHLALVPCYDRTPGIAEWWFNYSHLRDTGQWQPLLFERVLTEARPSQISLSTFDEEVFYAEQHDLIHRWANRIGYWFKLCEVTYSDYLGNGRPATIAFRIKNDGLAPIYPNRANRGFVKLALLDHEGQVLSTTTLEGINPFDWKPGAYTVASSAFSFPVCATAAKLALGVFTLDTLAKPDVALGNPSDRIDRWLVVSDLPRSVPAVISANCLYAASSTAADALWGRREARYAFDTDRATWWAAGDRGSAEWLEVDFGASRTFSSVQVTEHVANITSFRIEYHDGFSWRTACQGGRINHTGSEFTFAPVTGRKARILITASEGAPTLAEFNIKGT